jgi:hypothetical protein
MSQDAAAKDEDAAEGEFAVVAQAEPMQRKLPLGLRFSIRLATRSLQKWFSRADSRVPAATESQEMAEQAATFAAKAESGAGRWNKKLPKDEETSLANT